MTFRSSSRLTGHAGGLTLDGLTNVISGVGTARDKRAHDTWTFMAPVTQPEVEAAYRTSWLGRKIHDLPPFDMVRAWRNWQAKADEITAIEAVERRFNIRAKTRQALTWSRLYGGSALILGVQGSGGERDPTKPLDVEKLAQGALRYVHVVTRHQLTLGEIEMDPEAEFFRQPVHYEMTGTSNGSAVRIHPSRVIPFISQPVPDGGCGLLGPDQFWGDPLLQSVRDAVSNADLAQNGVASLIHEAKVDSLSIPNLSQQLSTAEYESRMIKRLQVAELAKSFLNTRLLDANEKWETRQVSFTGLAILPEKFIQIVAAAADIPVTRLTGTSAKGLNATGEGDDDNYDEMIAARQELELRPNLDRLDEIMLRSALGKRPAEIHYVFAPLKTPDPKEEAEIADKQADTAKKYVDAGLVPLPVMAKVVQNRLVEDAVYPGLEAALKETAATVGLPIEMFKALVSAWQSGGTPIQVLYQRQADAGLLPKGMTLELYQAAIEEAGEALGEHEHDDEADEDDVPDEEGGEPARQEAKDAAPRTLYVRRDVVNHSEIEAWAKSQGFGSTLGAKMHVTVLYSRAPVDWMAMGENWSGDGKGQVTLQPGGPRLVEPLGDEGAVVLLFSATELQWRHRNMVEAGASHGYPEYTPHITITYEPGDVDISKVEPYRGRIVLGPEIFEEIDEDGVDKDTE